MLYTIDINIFVLRNLDMFTVVANVPSIQFHMDPYVYGYMFVVCLHVQTSLSSQLIVQAVNSATAKSF
jgi:hypothetical protein